MAGELPAMIDIEPGWSVLTTEDRKTLVDRVAALTLAQCQSDENRVRAPGGVEKAGRNDPAERGIGMRG